ncbi:hypothetical protein FRC12_020800 [Ceratobasidium sp. 428]|nr:hypothetical protein FRC12_020800 [Ceratobasidium sp. 428]
MKGRLLATKARELVDADSHDRHLGIGFDSGSAPLNKSKWGSNVHGRCLMQVRKLITDAEAQLMVAADKLRI